MVVIYSLGSNSGGQLATGNLEDAHHLSKTRFSSSCNNTHEPGISWRVHGGGNHAYAWTDTKLLASGTNSNGELSIGDTTTREPILCWTPVPLPTSSGHCCLVKQVACGWNHSLLLTDSGQVYVTGSNAFGQLGGAPGMGLRAAGWTRISFATAAPTNFVSVACGMRHSLALDANGRVYGWGANRYGQLGIAEEEEDRSGGRRNNNLQAMVVVSDNTMMPPIAMIACGRSHSILVARDLKTVYVAGQDKYAQCGPAAGTRPVAGTWRTFQLPCKAAKLCSGWDFGAVLLESPGSRVAMWGRADQGQLACRISGSDCRRDLGFVDLPQGIRDIACGSSHVVAMTGDGSVYTWGWNEHGNAGDPTLENVYTPICIESKATGIGSGYGNSYIVK